MFDVRKFEYYLKRYYYENKEVVTIDDLYPSCSTVSDVIKDDKFIEINKLKKGLEAHNEQWRNLANDGTAGHSIMSSYIDNNFKIDYNTIKCHLIENYVDPISINKLTKAFLSFQKFIKDYNFNFQFTERSFIDKQLGIGGQIDGFGDFCLTTEKTKKVKSEGTAILDWKTGNYSSLPIKYIYQINLYRLAMEKIYVLDKDIKMLIVCPTAWQKSPDYRVFEVERVDTDELMALIKIFNRNDKDRAKLFDTTYNFSKLTTLDAEIDYELLKSNEFERITAGR